MRGVPVVLKSYDRRWLSADLIAGVTLAAVAIPEVMGYTSISQTPIVTGLYTVIFPTIMFALIGSSRLLGPLQCTGIIPGFIDKLAGNGVHLPPAFFQTEQRAGGYGSFGRQAS